MAIKLDGTFTAYTLSEGELKAATTFSSLNRMYMQTQLAGIAEQKLALSFDPEKPALFTQQEAYLKGQMDMLIYLLGHDQQQPQTQEY